jgi:hypothetical protein
LSGFVKKKKDLSLAKKGWADIQASSHNLGQNPQYARLMIVNFIHTKGNDIIF